MADGNDAPSPPLSTSESDDILRRGSEPPVLQTEGKDAPPSAPPLASPPSPAPPPPLLVDTTVLAALSFGADAASLLATSLLRSPQVVQSVSCEPVVERTSSALVPPVVLETVRRPVEPERPKLGRAIGTIEFLNSTPACATLTTFRRFDHARLPVGPSSASTSVTVRCLRPSPFLPACARILPFMKTCCIRYSRLVPLARTMSSSRCIALSRIES
mmetsp:Transcript_52874/g.139041  ORF Transcript_52874/g.139041 Transcript_52874/m.139041 type:complete len:216 (+) Transcript_52874:215-862(+)|eukprot:3619989-Prymnesium_polylepis.1